MGTQGADDKTSQGTHPCPCCSLSPQREVWEPQTRLSTELALPLGDVNNQAGNPRRLVWAAPADLERGCHLTCNDSSHFTGDLLLTGYRRGCPPTHHLESIATASERRWGN